MRAENRFQATFGVIEVKAADGQLVLQGTIRLEWPVPRHGLDAEGSASTGGLGVRPPQR